jgi:hypothetical protein
MLNFRISQPLWDIAKAFGNKIFSSLNVHIQKLIQKIFQAIQPMMNISGFLSRVFNVLITGLKAILHWLLPVSLLEEIHWMSLKIFGYPEVPTLFQVVTHTHSDIRVLFSMTIFVMII